MVRNGNRGCFWLSLLEKNELREKEVCKRGTWEGKWGMEGLWKVIQEWHHWNVDLGEAVSMVCHPPLYVSTVWLILFIETRGWSTAERNSPAVGWPAHLPLLCLRPGSVGRDFGTLLLSDPSWDCWKPQGQVCMVPSNVCQNRFVVRWGVSAPHCWDPPWTSALGGYFGMIWISSGLLELDYHKSSEEMITSH